MSHRITWRRTSCSADKGLALATLFFDAIVVPPSQLRPDVVFSLKERLWAWPVDASTTLYIDIGAEVKLRVVGEDFHDSSKHESDEGASVVPPPYKLIGSISEDGLGPLAWWKQ